MRRQRTQSPDAPEAPGAFLNDGSFSETAEMRHRGHVDRLVRALVHQRREERLAGRATRSQKSGVRSQNASEFLKRLGRPILREGPPDPHEYWLRKHDPVLMAVIGAPEAARFGAR